MGMMVHGYTKFYFKNKNFKNYFLKVAHPGLVPIAKDIFYSVLNNAPNQISRLLDGFDVTNKELTVIPDGTRTEFGFRRNISVTLG